MNEIRLAGDVAEVEAQFWASIPKAQATATLAHAGRVVAPPARVYHADGTLAAVYERIESDVLDDLRRRLPEVDPQSGIRTSGIPTRSRQFGARPRYTLRQREFCGPCSLNGADPATYARLVDLGVDLAARYADARPDLYAGQMAWLDREILPEYVMSAPYTSGIINMENALPYHRDGGNAPASWNAMVVVRRDVAGGELVVPSWNLAFEAGDGHALLFDAGSTAHGVTPMRRTHRTGFRISVVYYSLVALRLCLAPADELRRAQQVRTEREERRAGLRT